MAETKTDERVSRMWPPEIFREQVAGLTIYAHAVEGDEEPEVMLEWLFELMMIGVDDKAQLPLPAARKLAKKLRRAVKQAAAGKRSRKSVFLDHFYEISIYVTNGSIALSFGPDCVGPGVQFEEFAFLSRDEASEVARMLDAAVAAFK